MNEKYQCDECLTIFTGIGDDMCPECGGKMHLIIDTSILADELLKFIKKII